MGYFSIDIISILRYNILELFKGAQKMPENKDEFEEYEPQIVELDGESFEVIDAICYDGQNYVALVPYTESDELEDDDVSSLF